MCSKFGEAVVSVLMRIRILRVQALSLIFCLFKQDENVTVKSDCEAVAEPLIVLTGLGLSQKLNIE